MIQNNEMFLLKLGEVVLKGLNRRRFEQKLQSNIRRRLEKIGNFKVYCLQSTIYVEPMVEGLDIDEAVERLKKVFGISAICRAAGSSLKGDAAQHISTLETQLLEQGIFL